MKTNENSISGPVDVLAAWDAMADSIANRRDECIERGQNVMAELYRDMIAGHREARAAVAELVEAAVLVANYQSSGDAVAELPTRAAQFRRLRAALAKFGGA